MLQPQGFTDANFLSHVCQLNKALHGLKEAPRAWFDKLRFTLLDWGFKNSRADTSLFYLNEHQHIIFILIYVDDILGTSNKISHLTNFTAKVHEKFALKDLGSLHYFLGIQIFRTSACFYLNQGQYVLDLLLKFNMHNSATAPTPMVVGINLFTNDSDSFSSPSTYRSAIGALQYVNQTRLDISYTVNKLSQFLQKP